MDRRNCSFPSPADFDINRLFVELKAQKSVDALQKMVTTHVTVLREGVESYIESSELVPGDVMILHTGDAIAADGRLIKANNLAVI